jgi:hypothetical protein
MKTTLNKEEFKFYLINVQTHIHNQYDTTRLNRELCSHELEETSLNFKKIIYILDLI